MTEIKKRQSRIAWVAQAGLLIALLVVIQLVTFLIPKSVPLVGQLFTGSLVNLVLIIGAGTIGFAGTAAAAVLSPVLAFLFGQMVFPPMIPVVAAGNLVIVAVTAAFFLHDGRRAGRNGLPLDIAGIAVGAVAKMLVLWGVTVVLMIPLLFKAKPVVAHTLALMFSWPQLLTALIGGFLALLILPALRRAARK